MSSLHSAIGFCLLLGIAWAMSESRARASPRIALVGGAIQVATAVALLKVPLLNDLFGALNAAVLVLQASTEAGTSFVFGYLGGGPLPFEQTQPGASFILAFRALPLIIVMSALTALLTYWRILPWVVRLFSLLLERSLSIGGAVGLATAANVFVGMVEAPLFVRPFVAKLTRSELFVLMCAGMATIAGTVLVLYATILGSIMEEALRHLLVASLMSAPAAITIAKLMVPEEGSASAATLAVPSEASSAMDAITTGTQSGLKLFLNVTAMLVVLVALVHLANAIMGALPPWGGEAVTLQRLLGYLMAPVAWLMGVPWAEAGTAGALLGTKVILNELLAYLEMSELPSGALSDRSRLILTYALCGFANLGSLGILIGGLCTIAPERRVEIIALGPKSIVAGMLATCSTGAVVGMISGW